MKIYGIRIYPQSIKVVRGDGAPIFVHGRASEDCTDCPSPDRFTRQKELDALGHAKTKRMNEIEEEFFMYKHELV